MPFKALARFGKVIKKIEEEVYTAEHAILHTKDTSKDVIHLIKNRRSIKKFLPKDVSDAILRELIDAARHAPSAGNHQPWEFIIVRDPVIKQHLAEACYNQMWIKDAPVLIVAGINNRLAGAVYGERGLKLYGIQDVAAAIENMLIAAEYLGLGTNWIGDFSENQVAILTHCPDYVRPAAIIALGYPAETPPKPELHAIEEFVHIEKYGETIKHRQVVKEKHPLYVKIR